MNNLEKRDSKEMANLFSDPKYMRQAWKAVGYAIMQNPAVKPFTNLDKNGEPTLEGLICDYSYNKLKSDIASITKPGEETREPTELEMIMQCQIVKARFDTSSAIFVRDTVGAKPIDESKVDAMISNPYEQLKDEELELLHQHRIEASIQRAKDSDIANAAALSPQEHIVEVPDETT